MSTNSKCFILVLILAIFSVNSAVIKKESGKCVNPQGKKVSWYIIYSMSNQHDQFAYIDNTKKSFDTFKSKKELFPPIKIVEGLNMNNKFSYLVWNDDSIKEDGNKDGFSKIAHSKGMFLQDDEESTFLIHSLPRFPTLKENGSFVEDFSGNWGSYSQTWLCITLDNENAISILESLIHLAPPIQASNIIKSEANADNKMTELFETIEKKPMKNREFQKTSIMTKLKDLELVYFVRPNDVDIILPYDIEIPLYFDSNIFVGTWTKPELQKSNCDEKYDVINITEYNVLGMRYKNTQDHSKWAVTQKDKALCIGDLNRTDSQLKRAGGIMCLKSPLLSKLAKQFIYETDDCSEKSLATLE